MIMYLPVYQPEQPLTTVAQRRQAFLGLVSSGFRLDLLMNKIVGERNLDIDFELYDGQQLTPANLLYDDSPDQAHDNALFEKTVQLQIAGRIWTMRFATLPKFDRGVQRQTPDFVLFGGLFVSILLFGITWALIAARKINLLLQDEIGERRQIENKLRHREELLHLVIDSIPQFIFWKNTDQVYLGCNRRFAILVGINKPEYIVGKTDADLSCHPFTETVAFRQVDQQVMQSDKPEYHFIETVVQANGQRQWFDTSRIPLHDVEGKVIGILVTFEDITEQKLADIELQRSRAAEKRAILELNQFKTTLDLTLDGVFIREADTFKFSYVNQGMVNLLGYTVEELLQIQPGVINQEMTKERLMELTSALRNNSHQSITFETFHRHKKGTFVPVEVSWQYIAVPGQSSRFIGIVRNITERKQAEARLQQAITDAEQAKKVAEQANLELRQFKMTLDMTLDVVLMRDADKLQFTYVNQGAVKRLGYTQEELLRMSPLDINPELTKEGLRERLLPLISRDRSAIIMETVAKHKNGTLVPVEIFIQYIELPGQIKRFISIARDITERKQAEAELLQAKDSAEKARKEAEVANRAKSTFLANMSHELRTPLNGILGYAQILSRDKTLSVKQQEGVSIIQRSGDYLLTLINDILDLSKIEAGKIELYPTDFSFNDFIQGITELFTMRAQQKGIAFNYEPLSHLPSGVRGDEKRLRQILINLLGNAVKFTERGGVNLKVGFHERKIRFQVEDTGVGIAAAELDKIFIPFQQVGNINYRAEGTGLGLSITKKLVELMGGNLAVKSELGQGSTFWFALELPDVSALMKQEKVIEPVIIGFVGKPRKILVVDDKWENRSVLINLLTPLGFQMIEAAKGEEGLERAQTEHPDLIITDLVMPGIDGFEFTRRIKKLPEFQQIPVIAASASVFESDQQQSIEAGCNEFIAKPIRADLLLKLLQKFMQLTWIYEQSAVTDSIVPTSHEVVPIEDMASMVGPSPEQAASLLELAMSGDIGGILEEIEHIEKTDKQLAAFCRTIRQLAKNFEEEKICQLLEQFVASPPSGS
jgi:PAS domain S-box-containing protein